MEVRKEHGVRDVFGQLLAANDPESKTRDRLSALDVRINSMDLLVAGSDTLLWQLPFSTSPGTAMHTAKLPPKSALRLSPGMRLERGWC